MKSKIIVIDISPPERKTVDEEKFNIMMSELQTELFNRGYRWINSGKEIKNFYSSKEYLVLIDYSMCTMRMDGIEYMKKNHTVHFAGTALTYFRYLKLKKMKVI